MSKAPERCLYCKGDDPNCGFCENGVPLDTEEDWDRSWGSILRVQCRCIWIGERCPNDATQEDGLCDWCAAPGARSDEQILENPKALVTPDGELHGLGGGGELHDAPLADRLGYGPPKACWYDLDNRSLA